MQIQVDSNINKILIRCLVGLRLELCCYLSIIKTKRKTAFCFNWAWHWSRQSCLFLFQSTLCPTLPSLLTFYYKYTVFLADKISNQMLLHILCSTLSLLLKQCKSRVQKIAKVVLHSIQEFITNSWRLCCEHSIFILKCLQCLFYNLSIFSFGSNFEKGSVGWISPSSCL